MKEDSEVQKEERFTKEEFFEMIENGELKLSVNQITGLHGGTYSRDPSLYPSDEGEWFYTEFIINNSSHIVATVKIKNEEWFHLAMLLKALGLLVENNSDVTSFAKSIPYHLKRQYQPFGKGTKRVFIKKEAFEQLGFSIDGKPKVKRKYNFEYTGIVTLNINIEAVEHSLMKIMNKLNSIEDRATLCDVHRILKQIQ
ncbi:MAG: hypothetical protein E6772_17680 [Dysgonomonas sp.]|nr:hypothetical protein [Dysgonomonas sp.]